MTRSTAREFANRDARDAAVESVFHYEREPGLSTLAYVSTNADALIRAFVRWSADEFIEAESDEEALVRWEVVKFAAPLDRASHALLLRGVRLALRDGAPPARHAKVPARESGEGALDYVARIARVNGWITGPAEPVKEMPAA